MGIPELLEVARHWRDVATERFDDEDYEAVEAACRIARVHVELANVQVEREQLALAKERHQVEVTKRLKALQDIENAEKRAQSVKPTAPPWGNLSLRHGE